MKGNQVFGPGTLTIDVYSIPEDEYMTICRLIEHEAQRQTVAQAMSPGRAKQIKNMMRSGAIPSRGIPRRGR